MLFPPKKGPNGGSPISNFLFSTTIACRELIEMKILNYLGYGVDFEKEQILRDHGLNRLGRNK